MKTTEQVITMTSLEISELTGKRNDNVMVDVRKMMADLYVDVGVLKLRCPECCVNSGSLLLRQLYKLAFAVQGSA